MFHQPDDDKNGARQSFCSRSASDAQSVIANLLHVKIEMITCSVTGVRKLFLNSFYSLPDCQIVPLKCIADNST